MAKNSKKAWSLIRKISNDPSTPNQRQYTTTANQVAHQLLLNGKSTTKQPRPKVDRVKHSQTMGLTKPFSPEELNISINTLKTGKAIGLDNIFNEEIKHFGPLMRKWILQLMNKCMLTKNIPKIWRKTRIIALLKPGKDPAHAKSFRPISLLCHLYKLFERLILNRLAPVAEPAIIPQQAGFRPGKSTTSQLLKLTQHIEDGFQKGLVTGAVFVDLSAAYDTVNHRLLLKKILELTKDLALTDLIGALLKDRRFFVVLNNKQSRWRQQRNGLPQGSVLAPLLYNIYTNDQPMDQNTERFIYADDLCVTSQENSFEAVEANLTTALDELLLYYERNHLHANPAKTQVCSFHLRNREAHQLLNIRWSGTPLEHCTHPVYLGVTLDRTLTFKEHIKNTKAKVGSRNNILRKLTNSKWGATAHTLKSTALALCYSSAEYACPVWERSTHAQKLDPALNNTCRLITGCLKPTNTSNLHLLACIAPADIRRKVASRVEKTKATSDERHLLHGCHPPAQRLKSRRSFLSQVQPLTKSREETKIQLWMEKLENDPPPTGMGIPPSEHLPPGQEASWAQWKTLNRLRTRTGRSKDALVRWGYKTGPTTCECGQADHTMEHCLVCPLLPNPCSPKDLAVFNKNAKDCVKKWETAI